jgi:hypothetical protein
MRPRSRPSRLARRLARRLATATVVTTVAAASALRLAGAQHIAPVGAVVPRTTTAAVDDTLRGDRFGASWVAVSGVAVSGVAGSDTSGRARRPRFEVVAPGAMVDDRVRAPWWAPVVSAVVPGAGQAALRQDRWIAFAAVEAFSWLRYVSDRQEAARGRRRYQRIADQVARALYTPGDPATGSFEYYETMEKWVESGVYDAMPGGALDPEGDTTTFNGWTWRLARQTYWPDPDEAPLPESMAYRNALAFYERRAIRPEFRWSWRDAQLQQDLYRRAIFSSNAAYRRATQDLAAVLANHVLSTVDAYVTVRLRRRPGPIGDETRLEATLPGPGRPPR